MVRALKRTLIGIGIALAGVAVVFAGLVAVRRHRTFDAPDPALTASEDPAVIERGRYLIFGPAHCAACHAPADQVAMDDIEGEPPLSGGFEYPLPFGTLRFPNLTPDAETGIGRYTDGRVARMLRHGVKPNGEAALPVMEYQNISDEDIVAILSYLRAQPPVRHAVPPSDFNVVGMALKAFLFEPMPPTGRPPANSPPQEPSVKRGEYLVARVAQCAQCHTRRNMSDLSFDGPRLAGGAVLDEPFAPDVTFVTPNLTPDPETGHITNWTEEQFVTRFKAGPVIPHSPMPWSMFARMNDSDLRAIYRYLKSLPPIRNETGPPVRPRQ